MALSTNYLQFVTMRIIYVDFDGTIQENSYPEIGFLNTGVDDFLWNLHARGFTLVLNTYRIQIKDDSFELALQFIKEHNLPIYEHSKRKIHPEKWSADNQNQFIDDESENIPLRLSERFLGRKVVDFKNLIEYFNEK